MTQIIDIGAWLDQSRGSLTIGDCPIESEQSPEAHADTDAKTPSLLPERRRRPLPSGRRRDEVLR